jgi:NAD(P)-dependent dehydrogenase (short-subunit alcohol dehydrogenase family)
VRFASVKKMKLKDKVILVTGSGSGLGREMGLLFAREGAKVGINDIRPEAADNVATEIERVGGTAKSFIADVSNSTAVRKMFADFPEAFGTIDVLVKCWYRADARP